VNPQQHFDKPAMLAGVVALIASGLYFLDLSGAADVDAVVAVVAMWVGLALVGVVRGVLRLRDRSRPAPPG
jgi:hypothetical protein